MQLYGCALSPTGRMTIVPEKPVKLIPFVCPVCAAPNAVHLITMSRRSGTECQRCKKWLRATDVMRAMHAPRAIIQ